MSGGGCWVITEMKISWNLVHVSTKSYDAPAFHGCKKFKLRLQLRDPGNALASQPWASYPCLVIHHIKYQTSINFLTCFQDSTINSTGI